MSQFIDRRQNGRHKSAVNRQRFMQRFRQQLVKSVDQAISKRSITDVESPEKLIIPAKDTKEYVFRHGYGGQRDLIFPGNKEFVQGDTLPRQPSTSQGTGSTASDKGEGLDDFVFEVSNEEFLDLFFDDLALPDLVKKQMTTIPTYKTVRAGYSAHGVPTNINIIRTMKGALSRRIALTSPHKDQLQALEDDLQKLLAETEESDQRVIALRDQIQQLKNQIAQVPFIDTFDLRYNNRIKQLTPTTQAVMFCIMDVSGSMDKVKKDIAKRFFILLYLFLTRNYERIDVVFIRHHTSAKEVDEQEFFYSRETGGTVVSSSLNLLSKIIEERYDPSVWNLYTAQASDGDNWNADSPHCSKLLIESLMLKMQYYAYVEIMPRLHQSLWDSYLRVQELFPNFAMQTLNEVKDIYPVFRELFKRQIT